MTQTVTVFRGQGACPKVHRMRWRVLSADLVERLGLGCTPGPAAAARGLVRKHSLEAFDPPGQGTCT